VLSAFHSFVENFYRVSRLK